MMILFIKDSSADSFLHELIDCLVCKDPENGEKCSDKPEVTPSQCLFVVRVAVHVQNCTPLVGGFCFLL